MLTRTANYIRESRIPNQQKLLSQLKQIRITSTTGHFERMKALRGLNPQLLVELHNTITENSIVKNTVIDLAWIQAIRATLRMLGKEITIDKRTTVGLPSTNTYIIGPSGDIVPSIAGEEVYTIRLRNPEPQKQKSYSIQVDSLERIYELLERGEVIEEILGLLSEEASNAALIRIANTNQMVGHHRSDFATRIHNIIDERKRKSE